MTDVRPEWVEAGKQALLNPYIYGLTFDEARRNAETVIAVVAPLIRADERERLFGLSDSGYLYEALARAEDIAARLVEVICQQDILLRDEREHLRAQVEALPVVLVDLDPDPHGKPIVRQAVLLSEVLSLLGGESDE